MPSLVAALERARYRAWQFFRGLRPHLAPSEVARARELLSPAEFTLFLNATARDRRHSMDLRNDLARGGDGGPAAPETLQVAALLHDVGKGDMGVWPRVAFVLLNAVSPPLSRMLEAPAGVPWRADLWRLRHHARLGAMLLQQAGSAPRVVEIVREHTNANYGDAEVQRFIRADARL